MEPIVLIFLSSGLFLGWSLGSNDAALEFFVLGALKVVQNGASETTAVVVKSDDAKCERCWHYTDEVGSDDEWPAVCARCAAHVREIVSAESA